MVTVSMQPFAFRKIIVLVAAVVWLTATVVFADPVLMNRQALGFRHQSARAELLSRSSIDAHTPTTTTSPSRRVVEPMGIAPAEGPSIFSVSFDQLDTWNAGARRPFGTGDELAFWPISLAR